MPSKKSRSPKSTRKDPFSGDVVFLNPRTCGIYKDGGTRYKVDAITGKRSKETDNELLEHVEHFLNGELPPGAYAVPVADVLQTRVIVPRYYDRRWDEEFDMFLRQHAITAVTLGELEHLGILSIPEVHGSPSNDQRFGTVPYIKVSDIRALRINVNPTNLVPRAIAEQKWRGKASGLQAWDLITPNRASSNIGEFAILLPGEEEVVLTKEMFVLRTSVDEKIWTPFYLLWALCLRCVRREWQRVTLMQTNREDVADRYKEIRLPRPPSEEWAEKVSLPFRQYFMTLGKARNQFLSQLRESGLRFIANVAPEENIEDKRTNVENGICMSDQIGVQNRNGIAEEPSIGDRQQPEIISSQRTQESAGITTPQ